MRSSTISSVETELTIGHFDTLRTEPLRLAKQEKVTVSPGTEYTLFSDTGPGVVESLWMAIGGDLSCTLDGRIRIYNGPDLNVDIDLGTLLCTHFGAAGVFGNQRVSVDFTNGGLGFLFTYPIPYGPSGIRIAYYKPSGGGVATIYSMVTSRLLATDYAKRLRCAGARYADQKVTRAAGDVTTLASISGNPGSLVYHSMVAGDTATNLTWLERNISVNVDGSAAIESSGTEDWYDSAWYFNGRADYKVSPHSFVGTDKPSNAPNVVGMATDLWSKLGGIPFTSSCVVQALTEAACTTGDRLAWCLLYYQNV